MMDNDEIRRKTRLREAQSLERAVSRILGSGDLLCFEDLASRIHFQPNLSRSILSTWEAENRVFSIIVDHEALYPLYAFSPEGELLQCMNDIILTLSPRKTGLGMALWFGSSNSYLAGKKPLELLLLDPALVSSAARAEVSSFLQG